LGSYYALCTVELKALHEYLDEMLSMDKICASKSLVGALILFVSKAHRKDQHCGVDYGGLNRITVLNRYPLPLMNELRDYIQDTKLFSKIELKAR
jgi:hypothetical protein